MFNALDQNDKDNKNYARSGVSLCHELPPTIVAPSAVANRHNLVKD
jgi:hypothetical protein